MTQGDIAVVLFTWLVPLVCIVLSVYTIHQLISLPAIADREESNALKKVHSLELEVIAMRSEMVRLTTNDEQWRKKESATLIAIRNMITTDLGKLVQIMVNRRSPDNQQASLANIISEANAEDGQVVGQTNGEMKRM